MGHHEAELLRQSGSRDLYYRQTVKVSDHPPGDSLEAATALARQIREVVIPEVDTYVFGNMCRLAVGSLSGSFQPPVGSWYCHPPAA